MPKCLDAALSYALRGWHVFPIEPGGKAPIARLTPRGHLDATADHETIRSWWSAEPEANVAISLEPSGLVALDVDVKNDAGGMESLAAIDTDLTPTLTARTGSGGIHAIYTRTPDARAGRRIRWRPGLDLLGKGYIVAAPSVHASGGHYEWLNDATPAPLPPLLIAGTLGDRAPSAEPSAPSSATDYPPASDALLRAARARLEEHGPSIKGQGGDQHAFRVGAILLHDYALSWDEAWRLAQWWNGNWPENRWSSERLAEKIRNGSRYASGPRGAARDAFEACEGFAGPARTDPNPGLFGVAGTPTAAPILEPGTWEHALATALGEVKAALEASAEHTSAPEPLFMPAPALLTAEHPQTVWLVGGIVKEGGTLVVSGEPKTGKSWVLTEIALAVASGTLAFGEFLVPRAGSVAYFYAEDLAPDVAGHLRALAAGRGADPLLLAANLHVQPRGRFLDVTRDEDLALVVASARRIPNLKLLVLEPLRDLHSGEEDKSDSMRDVMRRLRCLGELLSCTVGVAHHSAKASADGAKRRQGQKMRGSSAIHGSVDSGFYLSGLDGDGERVFKNKVQSEIKGARSAGYFSLTLTIEDDPVTQTAVRAAWSYSKGDEKKTDEEGDADVAELLRSEVFTVMRQLGASTATQIESEVSGRKIPGAKKGNVPALLAAMFDAGSVKFAKAHPVTMRPPPGGGKGWYWVPGWENPTPLVENTSLPAPASNVVR